MSTSDLTAAAGAARKTHIRYTILALIAGATMINYLDRTLLSVAAPHISKDLALDPTTLGIVFSAFSWSYALAQIPGGIMLDRLGTRVTYFISITLWSAITGLQGAAFSLTSLIAARLGVGAAEAPCFPANSRVLVTWFPQRERARANSVYSVGMYFGIAFLSPLLFWVTETFGWRMLFAAVGVIGVLYGFVWWASYREPSEHKTVSAAEIDMIEADGGFTKKIERVPFSWSSILWLLSKRQVFGAAIGQFATNSTLVFFLTWFPTYLATERHMEWLKVGWFSVLPFIAASVGVLFGGQISDFLVKKTGSVSLGRKVPIVGGLMLSSTIISAMYLPTDAMVIAVLSLAFFGQGMSNLGWTLISEVAPSNMVGLTGGVFNFFTNLAGIVTPIIIGIVVQQTGSFFGGLAFISVVAAIGALSYVFVVGPVRRIENWASKAA